jgi:Na+-driven multidrug efflux pump
VNSAALAIGAYETVLEVWNLIEKLCEMCTGICGAIGMALLPTAAHSLGAKRPKECMWMSIHTLWIGTLIATVLCVVIVLFPTQIASIWSDDKEFLEWVNRMVPIVFYAGPVWGMLFMVPSLYEAMQKYTASTVIAFVTQFLPIPIFSCALHFTGPTDPVRVIWAYLFTDVFAFLVSGGFYLPVLVNLVRTPEGAEEIFARSKEDVMVDPKGDGERASYTGTV